LGRPLANEQQDYEIRDGGVAVLSLEGVMAPKANLFMRVSGGVSTQLANTQIESAMADPRVNALVLAIDSPGGSVFGTPELGATVRELSAIKPIVTVSDATLASAAYWVGSAANAIYISGPTVQVGSIGVVASHSYDPKATGVKTDITAGKYKRIVSDGPLTDEGRAYMQGHVDHLYSVFVDAVASHRATTVESVLANMADGRIFIGQQAIDHGLVDGYATVDAMVEQLATNPAKFSRRQKAVFALGGLPKSPPAAAAGVQPSANKPEPVLLATSNPPLKGSTMDRATLEQQHPALFAQLQTEFAALGATAERTRIQAVESALIPGHEALIAGLKFDGKTSGGDAALAVNQAERTMRTAQGARRQCPKPPSPWPAPRRPPWSKASTPKPPPRNNASKPCRWRTVAKPSGRPAPPCAPSSPAWPTTPRWSKLRKAARSACLAKKPPDTHPQPLHNFQENIMKKSQFSGQRAGRLGSGFGLCPSSGPGHARRGGLHRPRQPGRSDHVWHHPGRQQPPRL